MKRTFRRKQIHMGPGAVSVGRCKVCNEEVALQVDWMPHPAHNRSRVHQAAVREAEEKRAKEAKKEGSE